MYKIFIKFDTVKDSLNLYDCYRCEDEYGDIVEYEAISLEEVSKKVKELLKIYTSDRIYVFSDVEINYDVIIKDPNKEEIEDPSNNSNNESDENPSEEPSENPSDNTGDNNTGEEDNTSGSGEDNVTDESGDTGSENNTEG